MIYEVRHGLTPTVPDGQPALECLTKSDTGVTAIEGDIAPHGPIRRIQREKTMSQH
jgi:hypothetical protein